MVSFLEVLVNAFDGYFSRYSHATFAGWRRRISGTLPAISRRDLDILSGVSRSVTPIFVDRNTVDYLHTFPSRQVNIVDSSEGLT